MDRVGNNLLNAFSFPEKDGFQYSQTGDLAALVEKILKRNDAVAILSTAQDGDHFTMSYAGKEEFSNLLVTFLQRGTQNNCLNVLIISEDEKRRLGSFLNSFRECRDKSEAGSMPDDTVIMTHAELYGDELDSASLPLSFQPIMNGMAQARQLAIQKQKSGLNVVGTVAGRLFSMGRFDECLQIERLWHETICSNFLCQ